MKNCRKVTSYVKSETARLQKGDKNGKKIHRTCIRPRLLGKKSYRYLSHSFILIHVLLHFAIGWSIEKLEGYELNHASCCEELRVVWLL